jgi:hypothetical protein
MRVSNTIHHLSFGDESCGDMVLPCLRRYLAARERMEEVTVAEGFSLDEYLIDIWIGD